MPTQPRSPYLHLDPFDPETNQLNVIVDTPKRSRNKFEYDEKSGLFKLSGVLPAGASFPYDFGFVPSTRGEDGDPLDVLLLIVVDQIEHFFVSYNEIKGKVFKPLGRFGPTRARRLIDQGIKLFRKK